jgi:hypothetical protein
MRDFLLPHGILASDDAVASAKRKQIRDLLLKGEPVHINAEGEAVTETEAAKSNQKMLTVPKGVLA